MISWRAEPHSSSPSFFTTKEDGSGIGLSLSRQIMRLHGGALTVRSDPDADAETMFTLRF
jgi:signal transduction histidine kinase